MDVASTTGSRTESDRTPVSRSDERRAEFANRRSEARTQQAAKDWVREHQDVALLAAFAFGVFVGAWMRS